MTLPRLTDVFRDVGRRIGFYTHEIRDEIPTGPGIYAWYLPLYPFSDKIEDFLSLVCSFVKYDAMSGGTPKSKGKLTFNWETLDIEVRKRLQVAVNDTTRERWKAMIESHEQKAIFFGALMEASILLPPLYVGKADNLSERYDQHVRGGSGINDFHKRFEEFVSFHDIAVSVSELLFVCVSTDRSTNTALEENQLNSLLESILMQLVAPPFSLR